VAGTVMPIWRPQFLDANGNPLASGTVETFEAGTSTPLATYSDSALSVTNGTTITLNAGGFPQVSGSEVGIYLSPRAYKFVLKNSAGVTQRTLDNVYALQSSGAVNVELSVVAGVDVAAGDLAYISDGSGGLTAGRAYKADADLSYGAGTPILGFVIATVSAGGTTTLRVGGVADTLAGLSAGSTYYVSATAGQITSTAPAGYVRSVGVALTSTTLAIDVSPRSGDLEPIALVCQGRLTATSGTPVTTGDVAGATAIYFTPYGGNRIALYDGTASWHIRTFSEITISLVGLTASRPYDIFAYDNAGTVTIETLAWTNATTRATALTLQNGVYVKSGATTRRYLGTVYINASGGQTDDTYTKRYIWNYYNRVVRGLRRLEDANSWTYTTAAWRQANASSANQVDVVIGVNETIVDLRLLVLSSNTNVITNNFAGIGLDSTSAIATGSLAARNDNAVANAVSAYGAHLTTAPGVGYHFFAWLEYSEAVGTTTWRGDDGAPLTTQAGLTGTVAC